MFLLRLKAFHDMDVFEQDRCPRAIRERKGQNNSAKREAKRNPRGTKNETKMTSKFRSILRSILGRSWGRFGGSGRDLGRPKGDRVVWGAAVLASSVAPP